jgi:hypothetical protein
VRYAQQLRTSCGPATAAVRGSRCARPPPKPVQLRGARTAPGGVHPSVAQACAGFYAGLLWVARGSAHAFGAADTPRPALARGRSLPAPSRAHGLPGPRSASRRSIAVGTVGVLEQLGILRETTGCRRDCTLSYAAYLDRLRARTEILET